MSPKSSLSGPDEVVELSLVALPPSPSDPFPSASTTTVPSVPSDSTPPSPPPQAATTSTNTIVNVTKRFIIAPSTSRYRKNLPAA